MCASVDELQQTRDLETLGRTIQKLCSEYLAQSKKRNKKKTQSENVC